MNFRRKQHIKRKEGRERRVRYFNSVERVEAEVVGEMGGWCDLHWQSEARKVVKEGRWREKRRRFLVSS